MLIHYSLNSGDRFVTRYTYIDGKVSGKRKPMSNKMWKEGFQTILLHARTKVHRQMK